MTTIFHNRTAETQFTRFFFHSIQISQQHLKVIAIAVVAMALLANFAYLCWHYYRSHVFKKIEDSDSPKEVKAHVLPNLESAVGQTKEKAAAVHLHQPDLKEIEENKSLPAAEISTPLVPKLDKNGEMRSIKEALIIPQQVDLDQQISKPFPDDIVKPASPVVNEKSSPSAIELVIPPIEPIDANALFLELNKLTLSVPSLPYTEANCRFCDIFCPSHTRVMVPGSTDSFYLHANTVQLEGLNFIASQYPLPRQVPLFWRASKKACLIIDLTNDGDKKKGLQAYYPPFGEKIDAIGMTVKSYSMEKFTSVQFPIYRYLVNDAEKGEEADASVDNYPPRLHFEGWNDHYGITEDEIDQILAIMEHYRVDFSDAVLIHCRAGVGRTGTIIVACVLQYLINQNKVDASNLKEHLCRLILEGRSQRGPWFVQTPAQIQALWNWGWRAVHRGPLQPKPLLSNTTLAQL